MLAPTDLHRYACPCGTFVLDAAGPSWMAWDLATERALKHMAACPRGEERWSLEVMPPPASAIVG